MISKIYIPGTWITDNNEQTTEIWTRIQTARSEDNVMKGLDLLYKAR